MKKKCIKTIFIYIAFDFSPQGTTHYLGSFSLPSLPIPKTFDFLNLNIHNPAIFPIFYNQVTLYFFNHFCNQESGQIIYFYFLTITQFFDEQKQTHIFPQHLGTRSYHSKFVRLTDKECVAKTKKNKAGYTATEVACEWAGATFEVARSFGQEQ